MNSTKSLFHAPSTARLQMDILSRLTALDKEILRKSWIIVSKEKEALAVNIFQMIFEQAPDAKLMFSFMLKERPKDDAPKTHSEFAFHALRFIQIIETTVNLLDTPAQLDPLLLNLGKLHARHEEQLGFRPHYWGVFKECVLYHFRRNIIADRKANKKGMDIRETDSAIILWREVLSFIIERMLIGLADNGKIRKANKESLQEHKDENGSLNGSLDKDITQVSHVLRKTELSVIIPEYFMRRKSDSNYLSDETP